MVPVECGIGKLGPTNIDCDKLGPCNAIANLMQLVHLVQLMHWLQLIQLLMGSNQVRALCEDGIEKQFRIPGKLMKKVWLRENDIIIVQLWEFQPSKGNVVWRYLGNQVEWLKRNGKLVKLGM